MRKILSVFGTRPEAIKMCPVTAELQKRKNIHSVVCTTGQHKELLNGIDEAFGVNVHRNLSVFRPGQTLGALTASVLRGMESVLADEKPDAVLVHGDTTTAFAAGLAAFYAGIPVGHVEAGLRTYRLDAPFPEEYNRQVISRSAHWHFAPTETARRALLAEGVDEARIFVTGNTAIDALAYTVSETFAHPLLSAAADRKLILLTAHRRESLGARMRGIFRAVARVANECSDLCIVYPMHPNPTVRALANEVFTGCENVVLSEPLDVVTFHNLLARSYLVLTDSGGLQEEAPALSKPVLVLRDTTERGEGVTAGTLRLAGTDEAGVYHAICEVLRSPALYARMATAQNPYGDGRAAVRIADILEQA